MLRDRNLQIDIYLLTYLIESVHPVFGVPITNMRLYACFRVFIYYDILTSVRISSERNAQ